MRTTRSAIRQLTAIGLSLSIVAAACGDDDDEASPAATDATDTSVTAPAETSGEGSAPAADGEIPSWCGPNEIKLGFTDGFGGNSWRLVTTAAAEDEAGKCPSVTELDYADGQGDTQKAISDIQGLVAKGVDALVVFPDAGEAILPALRSSYEAGVVTVPYRVTPGGTAGTDFDKFIDSDFIQAGEIWGNWIVENLPDGGNVLMLSGPPGNSQGVLEAQGLASVLEPTGKYTMIGEQPFAPTNWDPAETQKVLTAAIAQNPKIDVIVSDFGPSLVGALPEFEKSGRSIPALATSDGNVLACFWEEHKDANPDFKLFTISTQNDHARLAIQWAVALASGGETPAEEIFPSTAFEDSVSGSPNPVTCRADLPGDIYLSAEMSADDQAALLK
jgi:ribose transport system substrate-binding protein